MTYLLWHIDMQIIQIWIKVFSLSFDTILLDGLNNTGNYVCRKWWSASDCALLYRVYVLNSVGT